MIKADCLIKQVEHQQIRFFNLIFLFTFQFPYTLYQLRFVACS